MIWGFGDHELDEGLYQLRRRGRVVPVEPKIFDVLRYLIEHHERVVSKQELLDALWPGEAVSDSVLPRCIAAARRAVRDDRARQKVIQTVHGRGYRFVAEPAQRRAAPLAPPEATPLPDPGELAPAFVGREAALRRLRAAHEEVRSGRGRIVLLLGEPGIGKTRMAEELGAEARRAGSLWLPGRCYEGEGAPAFWPWIQALRALVAASAPETLPADLGPGRSEIGELLPELREDPAPAAQGFAGEQARFRLFESVAGFLARAARRRPLVIGLDDLHWADPDSLLLVEFLAQELRGEPVLLSLAYRDVEVRRDRPLRTLLGALARAPHCERIPLRGLDPGDVALLVQVVTGVAPPAELAAAVSEMTEGNPFFVREVAGLLAEEGRLEAGARAVLPATLPQGIRDAIGRRLDSLSEEANELLRVASVIGREFDTRLLEHVAAPGGEALIELLGEAEAAQVVRETPPERPGHYAFRHALLRQTLYEELPAPQRVTLHRRAGEALAALYGQRPDAPLAELAHHFFEAAPAGTATEAVRFSVRAAERADAQLAYEESARHYERALLALDLEHEPDATCRCELLIAWGDELRTGGSREAGRERLGEAGELARRLGRNDLLARAAIGYRGFGEMGAPPDARTLALLEEARDALGAGHPVLRARLLARLTGTPPYSLSMATREKLSREAWRLARQAGDPDALTDAISARYWATLGPDRVEERLGVAREAHALAQRLGDRRIALIAHEIDIGAYLMLGDRAGADTAIAEYGRLADDLRLPIFRFIVGIIQASRAMNVGAFDEAEQRIRDALERGRGSVAFAELVFAGQVYWLLSLKGESDRVAGAVLALGERFRQEFGGVDPLIDTLRALGHASLGEREDARRHFDALAADGFGRFERDEHWLLCMGALANLAFHLGDARRGEELYALLAPYSERVVSHDLLRTVAGSVHGVLGELAVLTGRHDEAVAHYERALEVEDALGARPAFHASEAGLARALRARAAPGDGERARELLASAEAGLGALGARLPWTLRGGGGEESV